jgi:hypothetical protein
MIKCYNSIIIFAGHLTYCLVQIRQETGLRPRSKQKKVSPPLLTPMVLATPMPIMSYSTQGRVPKAWV